MELVDLSKEEFDEYALKHPLRNFYQTSYYGEAMRESGVKVDYLGIKNNSHKLVGASLILSFDIDSKYKYAYAPRGFLIDYTNADFVLELTEEIKKKFYKDKYIYIKIDPMIHCSERKSDGTILTYHPEIDGILSLLKKANYIHHGFNQYFETTKARWHAITKLTTNNDNLYDQLSKRIKNKLKKAEYRGVKVYKGNLQDMETFYEVTKPHKKSFAYYKRLERHFPKGQVEFYFAKIDTETYVTNIKNRYEKELMVNEELNQKLQNKENRALKTLYNKKMESDKLINNYKFELIDATNLLSEHREGIVIGAICTLKFDNHIYLLKEGFIPKYGKFNPLYLLKWYIIKKGNKEGYQTFNQNAITGDFNKENKYYGLNRSKLEFGSTVLEYIGEFDYIINPTAYNLYTLKPKKKEKENKTV